MAKKIRKQLKTNNAEFDNTQMQLVKILRIVLLVSTLLVGLYFEDYACFMGVGLLAVFGWYHKKVGITIRMNDALIALLAIQIGYIVSIPFAIDKGLAIVGVFKFLPVLLFAVLLMQLDVTKRDQLFDSIPFIGTLSVIITAPISISDMLFHWIGRSYFVVGGRFAGSFQYPNTYGMFLLAAMLLLAFNATIDQKKKIFMMLVMSFGLIMTGSRIVFALGLIAIVAYFLLKKKDTSMPVIMSIALGIIVAVVVSKVVEANSIEHITANASTLLGRFLYSIDALKLVMSHPLGLGYLGYYFIQGTVATGNYFVRFVHNDFVQLLLDVGWIPFFLVLVALLKAMFTKNTSIEKKMILGLMLVHAFFDFDMQYLIMMMILVSLLDLEDGKTKRLKLSKSILLPMQIILSVLLLSIGLSYACSRLMSDDAIALKLYPYNTFARYNQMMVENEDLVLEDIEIIEKQNSASLFANEAKAHILYDRGQYLEAKEAARRCIELNPYTQSEYNFYFDVLKASYLQATQLHDATSIKAIENEIHDLEHIIIDVIHHTSSLAYQINDLPEIGLPHDYYDFLDKIHH